MKNTTQPKRGRPSREDAIVESKFNRRFDDNNVDYLYVCTSIIPILWKRVELSNI